MFFLTPNEEEEDSIKDSIKLSSVYYIYIVLHIPQKTNFKIVTSNYNFQLLLEVCINYVKHFVYNKFNPIGLISLIPKLIS